MNGSRVVVFALALMTTVGCGFSDLTPTVAVGGTFKASTADGANNNNAKNSFEATTVAGSFAAGLGGTNGGILTMSALATGTTADTQSITVNLGSPAPLAAGATFTVGASQSGAVAYAIVTYAETTGSDNSKTKSWKAGTGTVKIDSLSGKSVTLSFTNVGMVLSDQVGPATGTFNLTGSGKIDAVSGL